MHIFWLERRVLWTPVDLLLSPPALELAGLTLVLWLIWFHLVGYWRKSRPLTQFWWYFELKSSTYQSAATVYILGCSDSCSMNSALISQIHFIAVGAGCGVCLWHLPGTQTNTFLSFYSCNVVIGLLQGVECVLILENAHLLSNQELWEGEDLERGH